MGFVGNSPVPPSEGLIESLPTFADYAPPEAAGSLAKKTPPGAPEGSASTVLFIPSFFNSESFARVCAQQFSLLEAPKANSSWPELLSYKQSHVTSSIYGDDSRKLVSTLKSVGDPSDVAMLHRLIDEVGLIGFQGYLTREVRLCFCLFRRADGKDDEMEWP